MFLFPCEHFLHLAPKRSASCTVEFENKRTILSLRPAASISPRCDRASGARQTVFSKMALALSLSRTSARPGKPAPRRDLEPRCQSTMKFTCELDPPSPTDCFPKFLRLSLAFAKKAPKRSCLAVCVCPVCRTRSSFSFPRGDSVEAGAKPQIPPEKTASSGGCGDEEMSPP